VMQRDRPYSEATLPAAEGAHFYSRRDPGENAPARLSSVVRSPYAWHAGFIYLAFGFAYMIYLTFFQRRLMTDLNLTSTTAGTYFLVLGLASIACGFLWGTISDHIGRGLALALNCLLQAGAAALLAWWPSTAGTVLSVLLCGLTAVAVPGIVGAGCGDRFGPVLASTSLGLVTVFLGIGQVLGPYLAGRMDDAYGSLEYSYVLAAGVYLVGAVLSITLRDARPRPAVEVRRSE
jgi:predicted MFS family arabinose efflux permease